MCGIAGYYAFGSVLPGKDVITDLLVATQVRGTDATGIACIKDGRLDVFKTPKKASDFVDGKEWQEFDLPKFMIMHCRATTQGNASDNMNNHPLFTKSGIAVIHNGVIRNDRELFKKFDLKRDAQVDSEIFPKLLELVGGDWEKGMNLMNTVEGGFACAAVQTSRPDELLLWRHDNPIAFAYDSVNDILYFASTDNILEAVTRKTENIRGFYVRSKDTERFKTWELYDDCGVLIGPKGKIKSFFFSPPKYTYAQSYQSEFYDYDTKTWVKGDWRTWRKDDAKKDEKKPEVKILQPDDTDKCEVCGEKDGDYRYSAELYVCDECWEMLKGKDGVNPCCAEKITDSLGRCHYCGTPISGWEDEYGWYSHGYGLHD